MHIVQLLENVATEQRFVVPANDVLDFTFIGIGDERGMERRLVFELKDGACADVRGVLLGSEGEMRVTTEMIHKGRNTHGRTTVRGVLSGSARAHVTGWIRIPKSGNQADAFLDERFLLLSPKARAKAEPMLEILANDVKASHAATVARLDSEQLFYCAARGIAPKEGRRLLIEAFVNEVIGDVGNSQVLDVCREQLVILCHSPRHDGGNPRRSLSS